MKEEGCILERQMFKAAALCGVTQLPGLGFANKKAAKLSVSMNAVNSHTLSPRMDMENLPSAAVNSLWTGMNKTRALNEHPARGGPCPRERWVCMSWEGGTRGDDQEK